MRATVHSLLAQAEYLGEVIVGFSLALLARATTVSIALSGAAFLMIATAVLVRDRRPATQDVWAQASSCSSNPASTE